MYYEIDKIKRNLEEVATELEKSYNGLMKYKIIKLFDDMRDILSTFEPLPIENLKNSIENNGEIEVECPYCNAIFDFSDYETFEKYDICPICGQIWDKNVEMEVENDQ